MPFNEVEGIRVSREVSPWKDPVRLVTTSNIPSLFGLLVVDGVQTAEGDRVLLTSNGLDSLVWVASASNWKLAADMAESRMLRTGVQVYVEAGTHAHEVWRLTTTGVVTIGSTSPTWQVQAGSGGSGTFVDLTVSGTLTATTAVFGTVVDIADRVVHVNHSTGANDPVPSLICGLSVHRGAIASVNRAHAGLFWNEAAGEWYFALNTLGNDSTVGAFQAVKASSLTLDSLSTGLVHSSAGGVFTSSLLANADVSASAAIAGTKVDPAFGAQNISTSGTVGGGAATFTSGAFGSGAVTTTGAGSFGNLTSNSSKVALLPTNIPHYGIAGLQQTTQASEDVRGECVIDPTAIFAGNGQITRTFSFVCSLQTVSGTCSLELYNFTGGATVATLTSTSTTPEIKRVTVTLSGAEKLYQFRLKRTGGTVGDIVTCTMARVDALYT